MTRARTVRPAIVLVGMAALATTAGLFAVSQHDATRACHATQQNYDTLVRLIRVPFRDPVEREQLLHLLGERPAC